ncbi:MAG: hypothetical protein V4539_02700 [Bacteroidota bacterium]
METDEKELSPHESLDLIRSMINKTKGAVADDSFHFLLWGWLVFGCCLTSYVLKTIVHYPNHFFVWWLMPVGGIISAVYGAKQNRQKKVKSFIDEALDYLWIAVGISFIVLVIINILNGAAWQTAFTYYILLYAIGTFVSGSLLQFKPLIVGGLINFGLAAISARFNYDNQLLIGSLAILISYIIPGHLLRSKYQKQKL